MKLLTFCENLTPRSFGVIAKLGVQTVEELASMPPERIRGVGNASTATLKELARTCLMNNVVPVWLPAVSRRFRYEPTPLPEGSMYLAGPYKPEEFWQLERAIAQLETGAIPHAVIMVNEGYQLFRGGYGIAPVEPLTEEEQGEAEQASHRYRACPVWEPLLAKQTTTDLTNALKR